MKEIIIIRLGELTLKGKNYDMFFRCLISNIKKKLSFYNKDLKYILEYQRIYIVIKNHLIANKVFNDLKKIFGISSISLGYLIPNEFDKIKNFILDLLDQKLKKSFKIECRRTNKKFKFSSLELKQKLANEILKKFQNQTKVDVINPDLVINIEVRNNFSIIFFKKENTLGGMPIFENNIGISMISGGIDSPVSSFLAMKKGLKLLYLHFTTPPHTNIESIKKVEKIISKLKEYDSNNKQKLYIINFTLLQNELTHINNNAYRIIIMRRMFIRIANILAKKNNCNTIITGESLGQVASQTIESIAVINHVSLLPILRPLITYDKNEIIKISKNINIYDISILPDKDCCTLFVPKNPITKPKLEITELQEKEIFYEEIINTIIKNHIKEIFI